MSSVDAFVGDFESKTDVLSVLGADLARELETKLQAAGHPVQFVTWRLKSKESLRRKLSRPDRTYHSLWDVTDLVGVRVAMYFEDSIEEVSRLVESTFAVDFRHSTDKNRFTDARKFGYRSVHYVCAAPQGRAPHADFRFEIQARTALQHAWAEVEHDLGYKVNDVVPELIRRRFSRVAGLLEIADQEFVGIRADMERYRARVKEELSSPESALAIDLVSLGALARSSSIVAADRAIAETLQRPLSDELFFPSYLVRMLRLAGISNTADALRAVDQLAPDVAAVVKAYFQFAETALNFDVASLASVQRGYALFFAANAAVVRGPDLGLSKVARLTRMYQELDHMNETDAVRVASGLLSALSASP